MSADWIGFSDRPVVPRRIIGFHRDDEGHWVADLECGHAQHVRHDPPLVSRPWVLTSAGRKAFIGQALGCVLCADERGDEDLPSSRVPPDVHHA